MSKFCPKCLMVPSMGNTQRNISLVKNPVNARPRVWVLTPFFSSLTKKKKKQSPVVMSAALQLSGRAEHEATAVIHSAAKKIFLLAFALAAPFHLSSHGRVLCLSRSFYSTAYMSVEVGTFMQFQGQGSHVTVLPRLRRAFVQSGVPLLGIHFYLHFALNNSCAFCHITQFSTLFEAVNVVLLCRFQCFQVVFCLPQHLSAFAADLLCKAGRPCLR